VLILKLMQEKSRKKNSRLKVLLMHKLKVQLRKKQKKRKDQLKVLELKRNQRKDSMKKWKHGRRI
jgi:hypothetical protein